MIDSYLQWTDMRIVCDVKGGNVLRIQFLAYSYGSKTYLEECSHMAVSKYIKHFQCM